MNFSPVLRFVLCKRAQNCALVFPKLRKRKIFPPFSPPLPLSLSPPPPPPPLHSFTRHGQILTGEESFVGSFLHSELFSSILLPFDHPTSLSFLFFFFFFIFLFLFIHLFFFFFFCFTSLHHLGNIDRCQSAWIPTRPRNPPRRQTRNRFLFLLFSHCPLDLLMKRRTELSILSTCQILLDTTPTHTHTHREREMTQRAKGEPPPLQQELEICQRESCQCAKPIVKHR